MNRRDTIIIAVLLNAGLLIVLFATSVKSDKIEETAPTTVLSTSQPEVQMPAPVAVISAAPAGKDEVDKVIQQYVTPQLTGQVSGQPEVQPNFLADLQAIGTESPAPVMENAPAIVETESPLREVKVKKGDVLERIARQNHVSVDDLMRVNKLSSTRLKIGQALKIPANKMSTPTIAKASNEGSQFYTIKPGDNPWTIAVKHHMKVDELLKINSMDENKARRLKAGDKIRIK